MKSIYIIVVHDRQHMWHFSQCENEFPWCWVFTLNSLRETVLLRLLQFIGKTLTQRRLEITKQQNEDKMAGKRLVLIQCKTDPLLLEVYENWPGVVVCIKQCLIVQRTVLVCKTKPWFQLVASWTVCLAANHRLTSVTKRTATILPGLTAAAELLNLSQ